jgi:long-subunit fatty acid transport protein
VEIGLAYTYKIAEENVLNFTGVFQNNSFSADEYKIGAEYGYNDMFFVRGGYGFAQSNKDPTSPLPDKTSYIYGLTAGAGIHYPVGNLDFTFDYGFRAVDFLGDNHIFSIKLGF